MFNIYKYLHISVVIAPSSGSAQLNKTIVRPYYRLQYAELSEVHPL